MKLCWFFGEITRNFKPKSILDLDPLFTKQQQFAITGAVVEWNFVFYDIFMFVFVSHHHYVDVHELTLHQSIDFTYQKYDKNHIFERPLDMSPTSRLFFYFSKQLLR